MMHHQPIVQLNGSLWVLLCCCILLHPSIQPVVIASATWPDFHNDGPPTVPTVMIRTQRECRFDSCFFSAEHPYCHIAHGSAPRRPPRQQDACAQHVLSCTIVAANLPATHHHYVQCRALFKASAQPAKTLSPCPLLSSCRTTISGHCSTHGRLMRSPCATTDALRTNVQHVRC